MSYQTFPWQQGSSRSFEKLLSLCLPVLKGKTFLDVGCNTGYFCGLAAFLKAAKVVGIDRDSKSIARAKVWFPECSFFCMDWNDLKPSRYDIIVCLSAIHYAEDTKAFIDLLMSRLDPNGVLVLEVGIAPGIEDAFIPVARNIDEQTVDVRLFPTRPKLDFLLKDYAKKYMGQSVSQAGDPIPRHIFHISHRRPFAVILADEHYTGKSSTVSALMKPDIIHIFGETVYHSIMDGKIPACEKLKKHIKYVDGTRHMQPQLITHEICDAGLLPDLAEIYTQIAGHNDFILDHYIPEKFREDMCELMDRAGYFVVFVGLYDAWKRTWKKTRPPFSAYEAYTAYLKEKSRMARTGKS